MTTNSSRSWRSRTLSLRNFRSTPRLPMAPALASGLLEPLAIVLPPHRLGGRHVVVVDAESGSAVDQLADDVGLARVPVRFGDHVHQDAVQRHLAAIIRPPRHVADVVYRERFDRRIGMRPGAMVQVDDLLA